MGVVVTLVLVAVGIVALRGIAVVYTNSLWFSSVGLASVWSEMVGTKAGLALVFSGIFLVACWTSLAVAERFSPPSFPFGPQGDVAARYGASAFGRHPLAVRNVASVVLAVLVGAGASAEWRNWVLFANSVPFGTKDPLFHRDIAFFVFKLPFLSFVAGWAFVALLVLLVITGAAQYLSGGVRLQGTGQRVTPQAKAQLSVILALIALAKGGGYYLARFQLDTSTRGYGEGAFYTDVHANLPALTLLIFVSLVSFGIFMLNIGRKGWALPVVGLGLWAFVAVVVGAIYPAILQTFTVVPDQLAKQAPYIRDNIQATRTAMGMENVTTQPFSDSPGLNARDAAGSLSTLANLNLWDPSVALGSFNSLQSFEPYYMFNSASLDRYNLNGALTPTIMAVRNLDSAGIQARSWVNDHLQYTHGYGAVLSASNVAASNGNPNLAISDLPPVSAPGAPVITQPGIYFGTGMSGYVIADTKQPELNYPGAGSPGAPGVVGSYKGTGGVAAGGLFRRAAFALRFLSPNLLTSNLVTPRSRVMFVRNVEDRVRKAAPFLAYDSNPYPVIVNGQIDYVIDAYTISADYPYAQQADVSSLPSGSGLATNFNYVRNSVKVVVNAYSGAMTFYVVDPSDPMVQAYEHAFPKLFTAASSMPDVLKAQLRYPQDLFSVQAAMLGAYHLTSARGFYAAADKWTATQPLGTGPVSDAGGSATASGATAPARSGQFPAGEAQRLSPSYQVSQLPGDPSPSFNLMAPYVAASTSGGQQGLTGFVVARCTPGDYGDGKLELYVTPPGQAFVGPGQAATQMAQDPTISRQVSALKAQGASVTLGPIEVVPVDRSVVYVRSVYVVSAKGPPQLEDVMAAYGGHAFMEPTLAQALADLFGAPVPGLAGAPPGQAALGQRGSSPVSPSVQALVEDADAALARGQADLRQGDLAAYQADVEQAQVLLGKAEQQAAAPAAAGGSAPAPGRTAKVPPRAKPTTATTTRAG